MADFPPMTDKAAEAFADYASMLPGKRSLRALADQYARQKRYKTASTAFGQLTRWSSQFDWQARIAEAVTKRATAQLEEAAEYDADTFLESSRRLNDLIHSPGHMHPGDVTRIRESVRKPEPKGATNVNVQLDVSFSQVIERIAAEDGLTETERKEFEADIQQYLASKS